ncbi:MAG: AmmeMemoRadiSam system protein A [Bacteroidales bacterium]
MKESAIQQKFSLPEKKLMLKIARETLSHYLSTNKILEYDEAILPDSLLDNASVFVSLHKGRALRGCIGRMKPERQLYKNIQQEVINAASSDSRFPPVKYSELPQICMEISVLGPMVKISSPGEIELGKHGIYIRMGHASGTFLPQVARSTGWTVEEFLGYCSKDKVGIGWDGWKNAEIFIYTAEVFSEKNC